MNRLLLWADGPFSGPGVLLFGAAMLISAPVAIVATRVLGALLQRLNLGRLLPASTFRFFLSVWFFCLLAAMVVLKNVLER